MVEVTHKLPEQNPRLDLCGGDGLLTILELVVIAVWLHFIVELPLELIPKVVDDLPRDATLSCDRHTLCQPSIEVGVAQW